MRKQQSQTSVASKLGFLAVVIFTICVGFALTIWLRTPPAQEVIINGDFTNYLDGKAVKIYTTSWCPYCEKLRVYLKANNIRFDEIDIEASAQGASEFEQLEGTVIPILITKKQMFNGFDQAILDQRFLPTVVNITKS